MTRSWKAALAVVVAAMLCTPMLSPAQAQQPSAAASQQQAGTRDRAAELARLRETDNLAGAQLVRRLEQLSDAGNLVARWRLAVLLDTGERGVQQDRRRALTLAMSAAEGGEALAWTTLGVMYATGVTGSPDYAASMRAYRQGARSGDAHGFYGVGVLFALGQGVERDMVTAAGWLLAALAQNDEDAERVLPGVMADLSPEQRLDAMGKANEILADHGREERVAVQNNVSGSQKG